MAQTGYTPILIYSSSTASSAPAVGNLTNSTLGSELAINITDGKLFYKDNANAIQVIGWKVVPVSAGGTGLTSLTANGILYAPTTSTMATSSGLTFDGTNFATTGSATATALIPSGSSVPTNGMYLPAANTVAFSTNSTKRVNISDTGAVTLNGTASDTAQLYNRGNVTSATTAYGYYGAHTVQSDVTSTAVGIRATLGTAAATFTVANMYQYQAAQGTFGLNSTVTNQMGFYSGANLTGATNNYSFYANLASAVGNYNFYANGTADNYFNGYTYHGDIVWLYTPTPTSKSGAATLSAAEVKTGILNTTGTTYTITLPTGANLDAGFTNIAFTDVGFDWYVINSASGTVTIAANASGWNASVGTLTVTTGVSAHFRIRRTAANTYTLYRVS